MNNRNTPRYPAQELDTVGVFSIPGHMGTSANSDTLFSSQKAKMEMSKLFDLGGVKTYFFQNDDVKQSLHDAPATTHDDVLHFLKKNLTRT